ncbi:MULTISPECIES: hypothetical protein [unclassified Amycolatopsis]|uniref:hypothetical protein n=1 Tax=unclassified Amycolatopsis TaxID=2618356 RepID=UPI002875DEEC|nr:MULTISPECIES: hypothetical protein [unclassified Amycolatopsis]MDS0139857.1 hypothetical protein [Amycolatopsis sp. 505]MDS0148231.1 hypothetical protein [Amycolatopsis sp. CM201R]
MGNRGGILVAAGALALLTACSSTPPVASPATQPVPSATTPVPTSGAPALGPGPGSRPPTTPQPPPPRSPGVVTSACPFLGAADISTAAGDASFLYAVEAAPDKRPGVSTYRCDYANQGGPRQADQLYVNVVPGTSRFDALVREWTKDCAQPAVPIAGVDGTARTCALTGPDEHEVMVLVAKAGHGQTRLAELDLSPTRTDVYAKLAQLLLERL